MKICALCLLILNILFLIACERSQVIESSQLETRTRIIGGVPVHERDYQLIEDDLAWNEPYVKNK